MDDDVSEYSSGGELQDVSEQSSGSGLQDTRSGASSDEVYMSPCPFSGPGIGKYLKKFRPYTITCSVPVDEGSYGITSTSKLDVIHTPSKYFSPKFKQLCRNPKYCLVLFNELLRGCFILSNHLHWFPTIEKLASPPFGSSVENGHMVVNLPNLIPPHLVKYATEFPKYIEKNSPEEWSTEFKCFIHEVDPTVLDMHGVSGHLVSRGTVQCEIFECKICGIGFTNRTNSETACGVHSDCWSPNANVWLCCGSSDQSDPGCRVGFHIKKRNQSQEEGW